MLLENLEPWVSIDMSCARADIETRASGKLRLSRTQRERTAIKDPVVSLARKQETAIYVLTDPHCDEAVALAGRRRFEHQRLANAGRPIQRCRQEALDTLQIGLEAHAIASVL